MTTTGVAGLYIETRSYAASAVFWRSLGFEAVFETDHGSGQWQHPSGGPYVFLSEQADRELETHPILDVADSTTFAPDPPPTFQQPFEPQHWNMVQALILDPDGRTVSLSAPLPAGVDAPDAHAHHAEKG